MLIKEKLVRDAIIASQLSMSQSWVRKQRFNRRHNLPHILNIDPVMIGSSPRYRASDVEAFMDGLTAEDGRADHV